ncbi:MAG: amidohydrolase family protein [Oscillospiraceae bacterium]|jgi:imidazolonepropionase-like amidohydrolase|nr:amidohydrolase family protein [Oscillospiraceae bacterium]
MLLIRNGRVYLGRGRYEAGWDVLCDGPVIREVGPGLQAPGAEVVDAAGRDVYPGLVLGLCAVGAMAFSEMGQWDMDETSRALVPQMDIQWAFDLRELKNQRFARAGITSYGLSPGTQALLAGQAALVHTSAERTEDAFLARRIALKGNYTAAVKRTFKAKEGPQTRMAMYQLLDEAFRSAQEYSEKEKKDYDEGKEVLCRVLRREIPLIMTANTALEAESVVKLGRRYGLRLVIAGAFGVEDFAQEIMDQGWHVMLGDGTNMMAAQENHTDLRRLLELSRKGLDLSIYSSGDEGYAYGYEQIWWNAAQMSAAGAAGWEIMDMMTIRPARALGVDALAGSLEPGKQADIILCRGCPAERFDNYIDQTIVAGRTVFRREAD